jgi:stage V sporulation protein G
MEIKVTDVRIFRIKQRGALLGYANIVLNNCFIIRGIRILENERNGRFVSMPSRRLREERRAYRDLCHPLNQETRELITKEIFDAYDNTEDVEE